MSEKRCCPPDDVSSAPESGTVCNETTGDCCSHGGKHESNPRQPDKRASDDTSSAPESGTVR